MKLIAVEAHTSNYPNPICFACGDALVAGRRDTEFAGWIWVTTHDGNQGWAPEQYIQLEAGTRAIASQDYTARELDTRVGDELLLHREVNEWGWVEKSDGSTGWVPMKTLRVPSP